MDFDRLYEIARAAAEPRDLSDCAQAGGVVAAILTDSGNVYTGVCIDTACSMGFCAEHSAAAAMITAGENRISKIIAVSHDGHIMPPCGRCREFLNQICAQNSHTLVMVAEDCVLELKDLLPWDWRETETGPK